MLSMDMDMDILTHLHTFEILSEVTSAKQINKNKKDSQLDTLMMAIALQPTYIFGMEAVQYRWCLLLWHSLAGRAAHGHGVPPGCVYGTHAWRKSQLDVVHCCQRLLRCCCRNTRQR